MTKMNHQTRLALVIFVLAASSIEGFTVRREASHKVCTTTLNLVPAQGKQLVAAFEAESASPQQHPGTAEEKPIGLIAKPASRAKAFVSRIFSIPGAIMGRHPAAEPALVDLPVVASAGTERDTDDVVLYPIVGFCMS